jgi:CrcB protein
VTDMADIVAEPVDPDVGPEDARGARHSERAVVAVISVGGAVGAVARYGAGVTWPTPSGFFPWTTLGINVVGSAMIGVLLVLVTERFQTHRLVRPFVGTGMLGGFTTFSTYAVDSQRLIAGARPGLALANLAATVMLAILAVTVATRLTRLLVGDGQR